MTRTQTKRYLTKSIIWWAGVLTAIVYATAAQAQRATKVEIDLQPCTKRPTRVWFVLNGTERIELDPTLRHWVFSLPKEQEFVIQDACASMRLGGARTDCRRATSADDPDRRYASIAQFTFPCDENDAWPVEVRTEPDVYVRYVRRIPNLDTLKDPPECACIEDSSFTGKRTLQDVRFPTEKLSLHLGVPPLSNKTLGLKINDLKLTKKSDFREAVSGTVRTRQNGRVAPREEYSFSGAKVAGLLALQRARADGSGPTLSSTAIDIDTVKLNEIPLTRLVLTVN